MKEDSQLITELLYNQDFDVNTALAAYLNSQARYTNALAEHKELNTAILRKNTERAETKFVPSKKEDRDMPW